MEKIMPTYEYGCLVCKSEFEVQQSIKDEKGAECPKCGIFCYNRLISGGTSFALKGDCWAVDNYSSKKS
jgi:putative FmdB family regulatory protein